MKSKDIKEFLEWYEVKRPDGTTRKLSEEEKQEMQEHAEWIEAGYIPQLMKFRRGTRIVWYKDKKD